MSDEDAFPSRRIVSIVGCSLLLSVALAQSAEAITYRYTGNPFTSVFGAYTTSNFVVIDLKLLAPLPANASDLNGIDWLPLLESYSFSDGLQTLTSAGSSSLDMTFIFGTGADGVPTLWSLRVEGAEASQYIQSGQTPGSTGDVVSTGADSAFVLGAAGTWALIPEPSTAVLLGFGCAALARNGYRRAAGASQGEMA